MPLRRGVIGKAKTPPAGAAISRKSCLLAPDSRAAITKPCLTGRSPNLSAHCTSGKRLRRWRLNLRSEEHTSELQSLMRISYAVFCLKKKKKINPHYKRTSPQITLQNHLPTGTNQHLHTHTAPAK